MLTSFVDLFRSHKEEAADTIAELVRRVVDGENVPPEALFRTAKDAGMDGKDVDAMVDRMRKRDRLRQTALNAEAAEHEMAKLSEAIAKHEAAFTEAKRRYELAVAPLHDQLAAARGRHMDAVQADSALLSPENMEPHIHERMQAAMAEHHQASLAASQLQVEQSTQRRRAEEAAAVMAERKMDVAKTEALWRDVDARSSLSNADERVFLEWHRGTRRAQEAGEKLPAALEALEAAKAAVEDIEAEARAS
jgi:hypothetical protein